VEILSAALKFNPKIKGIGNNNSEFLISQYADDSTLSLADDEQHGQRLNTGTCFSVSSDDSWFYSYSPGFRRVTLL
jgi:hypothetical protein